MITVILETNDFQALLLINKYFWLLNLGITQQKEGNAFAGGFCLFSPPNAPLPQILHLKILSELSFDLK